MEIRTVQVDVTKMVEDIIDTFKADLSGSYEVSGGDWHKVGMDTYDDLLLAYGKLETLWKCSLLSEAELLTAKKGIYKKRVDFLGTIRRSEKIKEEGKNECIRNIQVQG